ncbi:MAG: threonine synthase [Candidatus Aminicenantes bacterium]|nr:threonine synthase [Candidatus Aminicenantes bacterium]
MKQLRCFLCQQNAPFIPNQILCSRCGQPMLFADESDQKKKIQAEKKLSLEKYQDFLPLDSIDPNLCLGEGQTPLIRLLKLENEYKFPPLLAKVEAANPTLSFKDRGTAVLVQKVKQLGIKKIGTVSTGNMASSTAAYGARAGLETTLLVKKGTSIGALLSSAAFNPLIIEVDGDYGQLFYKSYELGRKFGIYFANSVDPLRIEGYKLTSLEICLQLGEAPDYVFVPVSSGGHLLGLLKGFIEFKEAGFISAVPTIVGIQAEGCSPIARAFEADREQVERFPRVETIAHSISNPNPPAGNLVLRLIRENHGLIIAVSDEEMLRAQQLLCQQEGLFVQPESASTLAAYLKLKNLDKIQGRAVLVLTGHGLKAAENNSVDNTRLFQSTLQELESILAFASRS